MIVSAVRPGASRIIAGVGVLVLLAALVFTGPAALADGHEPEVARFAGSDRFDTAAQIATATFPDGAPDVIVAAGFNFPDALAAAGLAGLFDAPILLVNDIANALPLATRAALDVLAPDRVHIAGGEAAVSEGLESAIAAAGDWQVERFAGADRFDTAALMAERFGTLADTAIVATGRVAADSLSAGPLAFRGGMPILLTEVETLPSRSAEALEALDVGTVLVLGGTAAVGSGVVNAIEQITGAGSVERLEGGNRFETAAAIARYAQDEIAAFGEVDEVALATGFGPVRPGTSDRVPADALSGAPYGGTNAVPLVPINDVNDELPDASAAYLADQAERLERITIYGGTAAVSQAVADAAVAAGSFAAVDPGETDAPELGAAELVSVNAAADEIVVRYAFDVVVDADVDGDGFGLSAIDATPVSAATDGVSASATRVGPNLVEVTFSGAMGNAEHALLGDELGLRPSFLTVAWVDAGAVEGAAGGNPEGSAPIGEGVALEQGETVGPHLTEVGFVAGAGGFGFSEALVALDDGARFVAVTEDGDEVVGSGCSVLQETAVACGFDGLDPDAVARAYASAGAVTGVSGMGNPPKAVQVGAQPPAGPDLVAVVVDVDAGEITYDFSAEVASTLSATFGVYDAAGHVTTATTPIASSTTSVTVSFPRDVLAVAAGAHVPAGSVQDEPLLGDPNPFGSRGIDVAFDAGETIGPALTGALVDGDDLVLSFDRLLAGDETGGIVLYDEAGGRTPAAAGCEITTDEVLCPIGGDEGDAFTAAQVSAAVLLGVERGAVGWAGTTSAAAAHPQALPMG